MYLKSIKACCAQAFGTVLAICSEISEEQCLKRIPDLVRQIEWFFLDLEVTTRVSRQDSNEELNDHHVSKRSLCIYMHTKDVFIAEATIQKQHVNEGICQGTTPILGSFAGYRENNLIIAW